METLGSVVMLLGGGVMLLAQLWVLVAAFKKSIVWGLLVLFLPFVSLIFIVLYFGDMKFPVMMYVIGIVLALAGGGMVSRGQNRRRLQQQLDEAAAR